jgi:hypothetical protein
MRRLPLGYGAAGCGALEGAVYPREMILMRPKSRSAYDPGLGPW